MHFDHLKITHYVQNDKYNIYELIFICVQKEMRTNQVINKSAHLTIANKENITITKGSLSLILNKIKAL